MPLAVTVAETLRDRAGQPWAAHYNRQSNVSTRQRDSERWYRAKYGVALSQYKLGQKEEAARLIRYLKLSARGFDQSPLAPKFQELLELCER